MLIFYLVSVAEETGLSLILSENPKTGLSRPNYEIAGHEMRYCETEDNEPGRYCKQCGEFSFQPNANTFGDRCRLRYTCIYLIQFCNNMGLDVSKKCRFCEYDQEIPQSQTADKPMAPRRRATQQSRDTRKTN